MLKNPCFFWCKVKKFYKKLLIFLSFMNIFFSISQFLDIWTCEAVVRPLWRCSNYYTPPFHRSVFNFDPQCVVTSKYKSSSLPELEIRFLRTCRLAMPKHTLVYLSFDQLHHLLKYKRGCAYSILNFKEKRVW